MAGKNVKDTPVENLQPVDGRFKLTKAKIKEMYKDDRTVRHNVNKTTSDSSTIGTLTDAGFKSAYFNTESTLERQREYSKQAYTFYPVYSNIIDYLSNMYNWRYTFVPSLVKDKGGNYEESYQQIGRASCRERV